VRSYETIRRNLGHLVPFHDNPELARERIAILCHFNPDTIVHALFCGSPDAFPGAQAAIGDLVATTWRYPTARSKDWMWLHGDLVVKSWHRSVGTRLDFDFMYVREYDLLFTAPLPEIYPDIDDRTVAPRKNPGDIGPPAGPRRHRP
jgi:hypothetical protein